MSVKVKICGITNESDALAAAQAGADLVGFMFYEQSPRRVSIETASKIARNLPPHVVKVGVFVDPDEDLVMRAIQRCGVSLLQFHGNESPGFCTQFGLMSMKAFRIRDEQSIGALANYSTDAWLLDAFTPGKLGGTGETFNWRLAVKARNLGRPIFLAGGLTPENVASAVREVQPYGVDVSSGVESAPGQKDHDKVRRFIANAKAEQSVSRSGNA
ncbi:MAG TPA: phosphoribosylanthranilate isomerase [Verrucomicrobiota bacterium]|nr:phosphoribosylanthranilate isomerase [Verrucomicrobiota bacterium]